MRKLPSQAHPLIILHHPGNEKSAEVRGHAGGSGSSVLSGVAALVLFDVETFMFTTGLRINP